MSQVSLSPQAKTKISEEKLGPWPWVFAVISVGWMLFAYFVGGRLLQWWWGYRDLFMCVPVILFAMTAPARIRGLLLCLTIWWLVALLTHDFTFVMIDPGNTADFTTTFLYWILAWLPATIAGIIVVVGLIFPHLYFASEFLLAFSGTFGLTRREALRALATLGFGMQYPYRIIENGTETISKPQGLLKKIGGPGLVIIRPANAVAFERIGKISQICGPGSTRTKLFEFVKAVVQLRPRWIAFSEDDVLTKDGIPLKLTGGIGAQIEPAEETEKYIKAARQDAYQWAWTNPEAKERIPGEFPVYKDSVFRAIYRPSGENWEQTLGGAAVTMIRKAVGKRRLEDIFGNPTAGLDEASGQVIEAIEKEALDSLRSFVHEWGVKVNSLTISVLASPVEVQERVRKQWTTAADRRNIEELGEAEAETIKVIESTKKASFDEMMRTIENAMKRMRAAGDATQSERFQRLLETIAANFGRDSTANLRYIEALEKLCQHPGARIIIGPPGNEINIEERDRYQEAASTTRN